MKMGVEVTANVTVGFNNIDLVKESALLTALRWSIQIYERKGAQISEYPPTYIEPQNAATAVPQSVEKHT